MLLYIISVIVQPTMKVNIHNQCSDFNLTSLKWFENYADWNKEPDVKVDAGSMMSAVLKSYQVEFRGAIMYKLQRKCIEFDDQLESTYTLLFVAWKSEGYKELCVLVQLMECDKTFHWIEYKLEEYYKRYHSQLRTYTSPIKDTWLTRDGTVLMTRLELNFTQRYDVLDIIISEGIRNEHTRRPVWLDPER
jgi:hypothetical protein